MEYNTWKWEKILIEVVMNFYRTHWRIVSWDYCVYIKDYEQSGNLSSQLSQAEHTGEFIKLSNHWNNEWDFSSLCSTVNWTRVFHGKDNHSTTSWALVLALKHWKRSSKLQKRKIALKEYWRYYINSKSSFE